MKIEDRLIHAGLSQAIIEFYHGRTRNKNCELLEIWACPFKWRERKEGDSIFAMGKLSNGRTVCYEIDLAKTRNKRINLIMENFKNR